jgi:hypothetical protein
MADDGVAIPEVRLGDPWFRWTCLGLAASFLAGVAWMLNDIRLQVRRSADLIHESGGTIQEHLPPIVEKTRQTTEVVSKNLPLVVERVKQSTEIVGETLPEVIDRVDRTTEVVAELADDIQQLKELAGLVSKKRDANLVAYTNSLLRLLEGAKLEIGSKQFLGKGLRNGVPASEWVASRRKWTALRLLRMSSRQEVVQGLTHGWYAAEPGGEARPLLEWVRAHHPETQSLFPAKP